MDPEYLNLSGPGSTLGEYGQIISDYYQAAAPAGVVHHNIIPQLPNNLGPGALGAGAGVALIRRPGRPRGILKTMAELVAPAAARYAVNTVTRHARNYISRPALRFKNTATYRETPYNAPTASARNASGNQEVLTRTNNASRWKKRFRANGTSSTTLKSPPLLPRNDPRLNNASGAQRWISRNGTKILNHDPTNTSHMRNFGISYPENARQRAATLHNELVPPLPTYENIGQNMSHLNTIEPLSPLGNQPRGPGLLSRLGSAAAASYFGSPGMATHSYNHYTPLPFINSQEPWSRGGTRRKKSKSKHDLHRHSSTN